MPSLLFYVQLKADAGLSSRLRSAEFFLWQPKFVLFEGFRGLSPKRGGMDAGVARREVYVGILGAGMDLVQSPADRRGMCVYNSLSAIPAFQAPL